MPTCTRLPSSGNGCAARSTTARPRSCSTCRSTTLVDSTSLGVLLGAMKRLREHDGQIRLVVPRSEIRRVFEITMLDWIFPLFETRTQAIDGETV